MNIAFFLTPKSDVIYENESATIRQALERMEYHRYTAIPVIDDNGKYVSTLTEGDLLWELENIAEPTLKSAESIQLKDVSKHVNNKPVSIDADIKDLISLSINQNFVPVVDDNGIFIGIVKRSDIINHFYNELFSN